MPGAAAIETDALTKRYRRHRGIQDVALRVDEGEVFGFLGPNGAGKTTLIRILVDLLRPTSGHATVLGLDSRAHSLAIRSRTSYLPGDFHLYEKLTASELLAWFAELGGGGVGRQRIEHLAERFQLDLSRQVGELSKGNRQKVGLVQALMRDAELYVLDEPTSGLDPVMQHEFHRVVKELAQEGRTVFLSSHQLDEVQDVAHRVGIIREGTLVAVEEIAVLQARAVRHVTVTFDGPVPTEEIARLPGVDHLESSNGSLRFRLDGAVDPVIKLLAQHRVLDFDSRPADLDEIFLAYYGAPVRPDVEAEP
jgi:ABC-2 type transport system ATP-binding protein